MNELKDHDNYYLQQPEPLQSCLLALKKIILSMDEDISTAWKYRMPCFTYKGKMFCYLWVDKKTTEPYILIVEGQRIEHHLLEQGKRSRMKILRINPNKDLPVELIKSILNTVLDLYRTGVVKT
jgi:uncharacterized protein YdhG (YjbR/CyaY superfamily)